MNLNKSSLGQRFRLPFYAVLALSFAIATNFLINVPTARAQALSGIQGTVTDESGAVIPDAKVSVRNNATGVVTSTVTSSAGTYTVTDLIPGTYTVKVEKQGFRVSQSNDVVVEAGGKQATADTVLKAGTETEVIEVVASPIALETSQPDVGTVVETKMVEELPIIFGGRGRQIDNFLFLTPGVQGGNFEHRINGGVSFQNEVVFNGVDANQSETQGFQSNINPPYEMISEFRVLTSNFSAQYGLAQGVAYYQFASGGNSLHADVFEIMRNDYFDARPTDVAAAGNPVPTDKEHNYGFSVGGPVWIPRAYNGKNKTFFHVSAEWYRQNQGASGTGTVPTAAMKQGDFGALTDTSGNPIKIFVPAQISAACQAALPGVTPGMQFPGNKIPQGCFSAASAGLISLIPDPDFNNPVTPFQGNFESQAGVLPTRQTSWGFSIDHNLTNTQKLHVSYWRDSFNTPAAISVYGNELSSIQAEPRLGTGFFPTYSKTFSPNLVLSVGFGWMGELNNEFPTHTGINFPANPGAGVLPSIYFTGPAPFAVDHFGPQNNGETFSINRKLGISLDNNLLWVHGRHTFNFGLEIRRSYQDDHECQNCGGSFSFSSRSTSDNTNLNTTGNAFASFLLGEPNGAFREFALETKLRNLYFAPYIQDNIKITPRLTVDVGVRWDILRPFTTESVKGQPADQVTFFNPTTPNPGALSNSTGQPLLGAAAVLGTCSTCTGFSQADTHWHEFSPRIGFAYKLNSKTVVLGGFSINRLDTGAYEYGNNKVAVNYGNLLAGLKQVNGNLTNVPGYCNASPDCTWDAQPLAVPPAIAFTPDLFNGTGVLRQFKKDLGPIGYVQQWSAGIQRELPWNVFLSASYVGNRALHLPALTPINQLDPTFLTQFCPDHSGDGSSPGCPLEAQWNSPAGQTALAAAGFSKDPSGFFSPYANFATNYPTGTVFQALLPFPQYNPSGSCGGICNNFDVDGSSLYNALQVTTQKRFSNGVSFLVAYTLSRQMSNTDSGFSTFNFGALNKFNPKSEWTVGSADQTHLLNISYVYELPIGPGKKFLNKGGTLAKNLIGGWQWSGVFSASSGSPLSILANNNDPLGNGFNRADFVSGQRFSVNYNNYYKGLPVFNPAAFSDPGFFPGNTPRNISGLRSASYNNLDSGFAKKFFFGERVTAELRMDFFNLFNRPQPCGPSTNVDDTNFGIINGGSPCQGNSPRRGQAYFKVSF